MKKMIKVEKIEKIEKNEKLFFFSKLTFSTTIVKIKLFHFNNAQ